MTSIFEPLTAVFDLLVPIPQMPTPVVEERRRANSGTPSPLSRKARIEQEVFMIAPRFSERGGVYFDEEHGDWLIIPKYPLPERWHERWCQLLIVFPPTYPVSAPLGFYLNKNFRLTGGDRDPHLVGFGAHGADDLRSAGWFWYCVQTTGGPGGWQPSADSREPDNLWTFLTLVREVLTNDE